MRAYELFKFDRLTDRIWETRFYFVIPISCMVGVLAVMFAATTKALHPDDLFSGVLVGLYTIGKELASIYAPYLIVKSLVDEAAEQRKRRDEVRSDCEY